MEGHAAKGFVGTVECADRLRTITLERTSEEEFGLGIHVSCRKSNPLVPVPVPVPVPAPVLVRALSCGDYADSVIIRAVPSARYIMFSRDDALYLK